MKYLVFGANGFLGSTLVRHLKQAGENIYSVKRTAADGAFALDITRPEGFEAITILPDVIVNCASALPDPTKSFSDRDYLRQLYETNVIGGTNIMNWAAAKGVRRVINCSTLVVVNKPWPVPLQETANTYPMGNHVGYSSSKLSQELVMRSIANVKGIQLLHLRISALYGPGMKDGGILTKLLKQASGKEKISLTNGNKVSFDFLHVEDAAKAIHHLAGMEEWKDNVINLASGEEITLMALAELLSELTESPKENITNTDEEGFESRAMVETSLLEYYLEGTGINTRSFAEKVKSMI
ncbi:NAD-dependent epimerase/dehydratase family protein [Pontibacter toksunensis]|uniref:NAD-dependent epimerase/dehydratase family protein n=1 Tax=Pontibacter toksunensis TaxID=1332631 RepID=A0ABW6C364_9BACT